MLEKEIIVRFKEKVVEKGNEIRERIKRLCNGGVKVDKMCLFFFGSIVCIVKCVIFIDLYIYKFSVFLFLVL